MNGNPVRISAFDFIQDEKIYAHKDAEISERGLYSFPKDSEADKKLIALMKSRRNIFGGDVILTLPNVPIDIRLHDLLSEDLVYYLAVGDYESSDLSIIQQMVKFGDKVMDIGGGVGVCATRMAQCSGLPVTIVEARKELEVFIKDTLKLNKVEGVFVHGAVCDDVPNEGTISFTVSENLWYSSIGDTTSGILVEVPTRTLESLYEEFKPDCVLMDIEGAEQGINFETKHRPRELALEIHTPSIGTKETCKVIQKIIDAGYRLRDVSSQTWWFTFDSLKR